MIILFEQFPYDKEYLEKVLPKDTEGRYLGPNGLVKKNNSLDGVGFLFNRNAANINDRAIFILPKVFCEDASKAFGEPILVDSHFTIKKAPKKFLANLTLWVCNSIEKYHRDYPSNSDIERPVVRNYTSDDSSPTLFYVMNSMKQFYDENKNLFVLTSKNKKSGNNNINWPKTVSTKQPFFQGNIPIYMELVNKRKAFDLDDRLIILYFSAMHYIEANTGFDMPKSEFYKPLSTTDFKRLLGHRGLMELRRIKHKYFADKFLKLYNIMKAFFEWGGKFSSLKYEQEFLITSKYNNVFEYMIDKLISDETPKNLSFLKTQRDGKEVDHLYKESPLIFANEKDNIWFIGDSKYYKDNRGIEQKSLAKQFTYAKNIIQYNVNDPFRRNNNDESPLSKGFRYQDGLTEGYSITPNFFIRGEIPNFLSDKQFDDPYLRPSNSTNNYWDSLFYSKEKEDIYNEDGDGIAESKSLWDIRNYHFKNRLFDRDTLLLQLYNVNFLYTLKAFISKHSSLREEFKENARKKFRDNFLDLLNSKYDFWILTPKNVTNDNYRKALELTVENNFKLLNGRIFCPSNGAAYVIMALEKDDKDDSRNVFYRVEKLFYAYKTKPQEIFSIDHQKAAVFSGEYDKGLHAIKVEAEIFEREIRGKKIPGTITINGQSYNITGNVLPKYNVNNYEIVDCYYLPVK